MSLDDFAAEQSSRKNGPDGWWKRLTADLVEEIYTGYHDRGHTPADIVSYLRDKHGYADATKGKLYVLTNLSRDEALGS